MSFGWNCSDDSPFVIAAIREAADASGLDPDAATFASFPTHTQSAILRRALQLKKERENE